MKAIPQLAIVYASLIVVSLVFTGQSDAQIDPDAVAGAWLFDDAANMSKDSSANEYEGEVNGEPGTVEGKFGTALDFDGEDDHIVVNEEATVDLAFGNSLPFSLVAWVNPRSGGGYIATKHNQGVRGAYRFGINAGGSIEFHREVAPWNAITPEKVPFDEFSHVAATYDGEEARVYINAKSVLEVPWPAQSNDTVTPVTIGAHRDQGAPVKFFDGIIDEFGIFNVALSEKDINTVMTRGLLLDSAVSASDKMVHTWGSIKAAYR